VTNKENQEIASTWLKKDLLD